MGIVSLSYIGFLVDTMNHFVANTKSSVFYFSTFEKWCGENSLTGAVVQDCLKLNVVEELGDSMYLYHKSE